jgi:hypothetical protein
MGGPANGPTNGVHPAPDGAMSTVSAVPAALAVPAAPETASVPLRFLAHHLARQNTHSARYPPPFPLHSPPLSLSPSFHVLPFFVSWGAQNSVLHGRYQTGRLRWGKTGRCRAAKGRGCGGGSSPAMQGGKARRACGARGTCRSQTSQPNPGRPVGED